jgi:hypothetical protein
MDAARTCARRVQRVGAMVVRLQGPLAAAISQEASYRIVTPDACDHDVALSRLFHEVA